jgi:hypothetical protein
MTTAVMGTTRSLPVLALVAVLIAAGCEADPPIGRPADWPVSPLGSRACVERPQVQAYLVQMKKRVTSVWKLPAWRTASESVVIGIIVDAKGGVVRAVVFEASDGALARSALDAVSESAPFPIPLGAECIAGLPIKGTFANPLSR